MTDERIVSYLKGLLPEFQWAAPYLDGKAVPKYGSDWGTIVVLFREPTGRTQERLDRRNDDGTITVRNDVQERVLVQFTYFGANAADLSRRHRHLLLAAFQAAELPDDIGLAGKTGQIRNITELLGDKRWERMYSFDVELFAIDTVEIAYPAIAGADIVKRIIAK